MVASLSKPSHTILVVDDDEEVLALAVDVLEIAGYTVLSTRDPRHALRLARAPPPASHGCREVNPPPGFPGDSGYTRGGISG
jgi:hypothetical protein